MSEVLNSILPVIFPLSMGSIGGFFVGYAAKKVLRLAMAIGVFVFAVAYMVYANIISLNISELLETVSTFVAALSPFIITPLTSSLLLMWSFIVGLAFGLTKG